MFEFFLAFNEELSKKYSRKILKTIFTTLTKTIESTDSPEIPLVYLIDKVKEELSRKKLSVLNLEYIIIKMMDYISLFYSLEKDSPTRHQEQCSRVLWKVLAQYVNNTEEYLDHLTSDILKEFESTSSVSVNKIGTKLQRKKRYQKLPPDAIYECVESIFDYFVAKGHIKLL